MEDNNLQKELFEFEVPKRRARARFGQFLQKGDFCLALTAEKLVFLSIGIIMLVVVFFALGVERGKALAIKSEAQPVPTQTAASQVPAKVVEVKDKNAALTQTQISKDKPYTIVAAAFSRQDFASKEASMLKASGLDAFVYKSEPYYLACVGSFANKDSALKLLGKVRQMHRDAYVRLR